jgi:hypothetical protein
VKGILLGLAMAALVLSCAVGGNRKGEDRITKLNEITSLWTQIRQFRAEMNMPLEPAASMLTEYRDKTVKDAQRVCPDNHKVPKPCEDTCTLSGHICENAELICKIADELGEHDRAQEKCTSAKASCREAKQRCCNCSAKPPMQTVPPVVEPAP